MPKQGGSGINGIPWDRCDRCGWDYQIDQLVQQQGKLLCIDKCYDNPLIFEREAIIAEVLEFSTQSEMEPVGIQRQDEQGHEEEGF